jgi:cytochrome c biogenesis protein CcdA
MRLKLLTVVSACALAALPARASIVVQNPGFETQTGGAAADWNVLSGTVSDVLGNGVAGSYGETFGPGGAKIDQTGIVLPAGAGTYNITFEAMDLVSKTSKIATEDGTFSVNLASAVSDGPVSTSILAGGVTVAAYQSYTVQITTTAGGSRDLDFTYNSDGVSGMGLLDNITVTAVVPEPTTMIAGLSLLVPFGASTLRILRRKQSA